jgi:FkbM family methyltransferase
MHIIPERQREQAWFSNESILRSIIGKYRVDLILDVGANKGQFALRVRKFYKGPIISFEPVSGVFAVLEKAASRDKNWFTFNYALGSKSEERNINVHQNLELSSLLEKNERCVEMFGDGDARSQKELIKIRRFDDIIAEMPFDVSARNILLKMDTQGYDMEVFEGARSIRENTVALQSEVSQTPLYHDIPHWTGNIDVYEKAGFRFAGLYPVNRDGLYYIASDCLMVK